MWFHPSTGWSPEWENLGSLSSSGVQFNSNIAAASTDGRIELFALGPDNAMYHKWFHPSSGWSPAWENLGGKFKFGPGASSSTKGRIEVFGVGTDNSFWHTWFGNTV